VSFANPSAATGRGGRITSWLSRVPAPVLIAYAIATSFGVYFCMYAFRKPFDAVVFDRLYFFGTATELKTACVIAQIVGYTLSKYLGTKICSEAGQHARAPLLVGLILLSEAGLLIFALVPTNAKPLAMLLNGLSLGMVWGLVVRYLEGRRATELMLAGLSCSFIVAGAVTRDIGRELVMKSWHFEEAWMPAVTGGLFVVPLVVLVWLLDRLPAPTPADEAARSVRQTMGRQERRAFLGHFGLALTLMLVAYFLLTAFRDFRDHYAAELFVALGLQDETAIFSRTEKWALFAAIGCMAGLNLFTNHRRAIVAVHLVIVGGFAILGFATLAFVQGWLSGYGWMVWVGVGMYLAYVPYGAVLFERLMAGSRLAGTSVFAIQLADGIGYTGSVLVQLYRDLFHGDSDRLAFIIPYASIVAVVGALCMTASASLTLRRFASH
jgi:hypothetical protein